MFVAEVHPREDVRVVMRTSHSQGFVEQGADSEHCPETAAKELSGFLN